MKLTYADYSNYHAQKCATCKGAKRVQRDGIWVTCGCQFNATAKWRYDQIQIYPEGLKFKTWDDFCGISATGAMLTPESLVEAKGKALSYCFDSPNPSLAKDRVKNSVVLDHVRDGRNVIISGTTGSGRSLLAALILKEVVYATAIKQRNVSFHWVRAAELTEAARWATSRVGSVAKAIDRESLDNWSETDFLFLDGMETKADTGDHRAPPDMTSINLLFSHRLAYKLPTILVCSDRFLKASKTPGYWDKIREQWGDDFLSLMNDPGAVLIELTKAGKIG